VELSEHKSNIRPGYSAVLHIHTTVAAVQLKELIALIDHKASETTREYPKFLKQNQIATGIFELSQRGQTI
jgi:peptide chain release factor subunit 3